MPAPPSGSPGIGTEDGLCQDLLTATLDAAIDGIIVTCHRGIIRLFSRGAENMFGYSSEEITGHSINELMPESQHDRHDNYIRRYMTTGERKVMGIGRRLQAVNKDGEVFPVHLSLGQFQADGEPMFVGIARDMRVQSDLESELDEERAKSRRLQNRLHQVYRSSVLSELVASIAHEINQPLAAITTYADVTRRVLNNGATDLQTIESNLRKIAAQALRAGDVIQQMRNLAPNAQMVSETARVSEFIVELMDIIYAEARDAGCEVRVRLEKNLPAVKANPTQIQHVLLLLLRNSLESFSGDERRDDGIIISGQRHSGDYVELAVTDHGSGVESRWVDTLYHPFTSNKADRMGIGLSICSTIINNHGGRIWHEPNPNGGTHFKFTLPIHANQGQGNV